MTVSDTIETINQAIRDAGEWVARQRWFGEKTRPITAVEPAWQWFFSLDGVDVALASVLLTFADGGQSRYFVPLAITAHGMDVPDHAIIAALEDGRRVVDALHIPAFQRWWLERMAKGDTASGTHETWQWSHVGDYGATLRRASELPGRVLTGEQSNTSLLFGRDLILKVFRRLEPGLNPDVEIGRYLTGNFPSVPVPRTYGDASLSAGGERYTVSAAQQFVANDGDCWQWLLRVLATGLPADITDAAQTIALLGQRTGELHLALGAETDEPAFQPEPVDTAYCARWRASLRHELELTIHLLRQAGRIPAYSDLADRLEHLLEDAIVLEGTEAIRVHGDYHLGQVLLTVDGDVSILDFEGEPSRPIEDRRRRYPALKDVAGMTRSLDYARATVARMPSPSVGAREDVDAWFARVRSDFLAAYRAAMRPAEGRLLPADSRDFDAALALFELEKALYEARYELNNRPDWVSIPYAAIRAIAAQGA